MEKLSVVLEALGKENSVKLYSKKNPVGVVRWFVEVKGRTVDGYGYGDSPVNAVRDFLRKEIEPC